jgi:DNA repair protein RadD
MGLTLSTVAVSSVNYSLHQKEGKPNSLKVTYRCGSDSYSHWLCFEHQGFAQQKARTWFCQLTGELPPPTSAEVVDWLRTNNPPKPKQIVVLNGQKYPEIKEVLFDEIENSTW